MAGWSERNGSSSSWRKVRRMVLVRDGRVCQMKGPRCTGVATTVDHVVPLALGGSDHPSNLRAACAACNTSSGAGLSSRAGRLGPPSRRWV